MEVFYGSIPGLLSLAFATQAQVTPLAQPVAAPVTPTVVMTDAAPNVLRAGTPISLKLSQELTTQKKKLRTGQRFQMEVVEAVLVNGQVVIPAGSPATGEVTQVRNKGMWGKSGYIGAQALYVRANGRQIRLTGQFDDKGITGTAGVIGAVALVPIAGFFMTGTSARIPMGAPVKAFIDEDIAVAFAAPPAPMMVAPAAAPTPPTAPTSAMPTGGASNLRP